MSFRFESNSQPVKQIIQEAFKNTVQLYALENTKVISEVGAFPTHPNSDIVDTGKLRASQQLDFNSEFEAELSWLARSIYVNQGYVTRSGSIVLGRPWHKLAAKRVDIKATFAKQLEGKL